jgi:SAM-dependent methyltransferase
MKPSESLWERSHLAHGVLERRITGELPQMEASLFLAKEIRANFQHGETVLDVGSGPGHFLLSLKSFLPENDYCGVDISRSMVEAGRRHFPVAKFHEASIYDLHQLGSQFDHVICSNVLLHVDALWPALKSLFDATRRFLYIRTLVGDQTFLIKHVHNSQNYRKVSDVAPGAEIDHDNCPLDFHHFNIYSKSLIGEFCRELGARSVSIFDDTFMDLEKIKREKKEGQNVSVVVDGRLVIGSIICPWAYVIVRR